MGSLGSFALNKKILLYLASFESFSDAWEVPIAVSQDGISDRLGLKLSNLSRTLSPLLEQGLIQGRLAHVKGIERRRQVYFLTEHGRLEVKNIQANLNHRTLPVKDPEGALKELNVSKTISLVTEKLNKRPEIIDILEYLRTRDVFNINEFVSNYKKIDLIFWFHFLV